MASDEVSLELAPEMNKIINTYFLTDNFENIEHEIAGSMGVDEYLPLNSIESARDYSELKEDVKLIVTGNNKSSDSPQSKWLLIISNFY